MSHRVNLYGLNSIEWLILRNEPYKGKITFTFAPIP